MGTVTQVGIYDVIFQRSERSLDAAVASVGVIVPEVIMGDRCTH